MLYVKPSSSAFTLALLLVTLQNSASAAPIPSRVASLQRSGLLEDLVPLGMVENMTGPLASSVVHAADTTEPSALLKRSSSQHSFSVKERSPNLGFTRKHPRGLTPRAQFMNEIEDKEIIDRMANRAQSTLDEVVQVHVLDELPSVFSDLVRPDLRRHPRDFLTTLGDTLTTKLGNPLLETVPKILAEPKKIIKDLKEVPFGLVGRREHARDFTTFKHRGVLDVDSKTFRDILTPSISTGNILSNKPLQFLPVIGSELQSVSSSLPIKLLRKDQDSDSNLSSHENDDDDDEDKDKNDNEEDQDRETPSSNKDFAKDASEAAMKSHKASTNHRSIDSNDEMNGSLRARSNTNSAHTSETGARLRPDTKCNTT
ncbi:hypothetical protein [Phaffia rhodozyma]|uniref:Uncharacterized protein n=1 Tax=Phaffia rhodozyma TaxID=264483 RepID=A0A0F7SVR0_PHARH|nr:hypothetical protein [Phaffia rhodozyma]